MAANTDFNNDGSDSDVTDVYSPASSINQVSQRSHKVPSQSFSQDLTNEIITGVNPPSLNSKSPRDPRRSTNTPLSFSQYSSSGPISVSQEQRINEDLNTFAEAFNNHEVIFTLSQSKRRVTPTSEDGLVSSPQQGLNCVASNPTPSKRLRVESTDSELIKNLLQKDAASSNVRQNYIEPIDRVQGMGFPNSDTNQVPLPIMDQAPSRYYNFDQLPSQSFTTNRDISTNCADQVPSSTKSRDCQQFSHHDNIPPSTTYDTPGFDFMETVGSRGSQSSNIDLSFLDSITNIPPNQLPQSISYQEPTTQSVLTDPHNPTATIVQRTNNTRIEHDNVATTSAVVGNKATANSYLFPAVNATIGMNLNQPGANSLDMDNVVDQAISNSDVNLSFDERDPLALVRLNKIPLTTNILDKYVIGPGFQNINDASRSTVLHWLCAKSVWQNGEENFSELATHLLSNGADPTNVDIDGDNVLMLAIMFSSVDVYNAILSFPQYVDDVKLWTQVNKAGNTILHLALGSSTFSDQSFVEFILKKMRDMTRKSKRTPIAVKEKPKRNHKSVPSTAVNEPSTIDINSVNKDGNTALHLVFLGNTYKKSVLYAHKVCDQLVPTDYKKRDITAAYFSTRCNKMLEPLTYRLLSENADIKVKNKNGHLPIDCAIKLGCSQTVLIKLFDESFDATDLKRLSKSALAMKVVPLQLLSKLTKKIADFGFYVTVDVKNKDLREQLEKLQCLKKLPLFPTLKLKIKERKYEEVLEILQEMGDENMIEQVRKIMPYFLTYISNTFASNKFINPFTQILINKFRIDPNHVDHISGFVLHNIIENWGKNPDTSVLALRFLLENTNVSIDFVHSTYSFGNITPLQYALYAGVWRAAEILIFKKADTSRIKIKYLPSTGFTVCFQLLIMMGVKINETDIIEHTLLDQNPDVRDELNFFFKYRRDIRKRTNVPMLAHMCVKTLCEVYGLKLPEKENRQTEAVEEVDLEEELVEVIGIDSD